MPGMPRSWTDFVIELPQLVHMLFAFAFGACAGSFIHVVAWRMPEGMSVISPPSRCPVCGYKLPWYDNVPVIGWLRLRGRCGACQTPIPARYLLSELAIGLLFVLVYLLLYSARPGSFWYPVGQGWWAGHGIATTLPALFVVLYAIGSLIAMTLCDARTYLIPVAIPTWASIVAFAGWPIAALVAPHPEIGTPHPFPMEMPPWWLALGATGALGGLAIGRMLLAAGVLPRSFADYEEYLANEDDTFADYPHARREMIKEVAFLGPAFLLGGIGALLSRIVAQPEQLPLPVQAFFACAAGFVIAGLIVWIVRILATTLLGIEALGMGDVHLLACAGAAFGWKVAAIGFLLAPFIGLAWWTVNLVRHAPMRMPFGPALAIGSIVAFLGRPLLATVLDACLGAMSQVAAASRERPGGTLAFAGLLGVAAVVAAIPVRRGQGWGAAASILLMVLAVVAWIFSSPMLPVPGAVVGLLLVAGCIAAGRIAQPHLEPESGPRTVLARVLRLLAFAIVVLGAFLLVTAPAGRPGEEIPLGDGGSPLHPPAGTVQ